MSLSFEECQLANQNLLILSHLVKIWILTPNIAFFLVHLNLSLTLQIDGLQRELPDGTAAWTFYSIVLFD